MPYDVQGMYPVFLVSTSQYMLTNVSTSQYILTIVKIKKYILSMYKIHNFILTCTLYVLLPGIVCTKYVLSTY
jgi:hypothetical protein